MTNPLDRMAERASAYAALEYPDFPIVGPDYFEQGKHAIATNEGDGTYFKSQSDFFQWCADNNEDPIATKPVIARWNPATIDGDDILGCIEDQLPDDDLGGDPITEKAVCEAAAEAAQKVLDEANLGAYTPIKKKPFIPDAWREMYTKRPGEPISG